jgi:putative methyltransferase (TIGR04325 family)
MLVDQIDGKNSSWAIRWYASLFLKNKLCLYPQKSFVCNIGFDGSGVHCGSTDLSDVQLVTFYKRIKKIPILENDECRKSFEFFFRKTYHPIRWWNFFKKIKMKKKETPASNVHCSQKYGFFGDYSSWEEVDALCHGGYEQSNILEATLTSTLKVKNGEAIFERDSFIFDEIQYSFGMLASLLKVAIENKNSLKVLDFGGALGSHYFQNKEFLKPIKIKKWIIVEQERYVKVGKEKIADKILDFAYSIDEVKNANVLIASGVLQYLNTPYEWLKKLVDKEVPYIVFDRTAFSWENRDRLTLQKVSPKIYEASYPAWFLNEKRFLDIVQEKYQLIVAFDDPIDTVKEIPSIYKGFLFKLKE